MLPQATCQTHWPQGPPPSSFRPAFAGKAGTGFWYIEEAFSLLEAFLGLFLTAPALSTCSGVHMRSEQIVLFANREQVFQLMGMPIVHLEQLGTCSLHMGMHAHLLQYTHFATMPHRWFQVAPTSKNTHGQPQVLSKPQDSWWHCSTCSQQSTCQLCWHNAVKLHMMLDIVKHVLH